MRIVKILAFLALVMSVARPASAQTQGKVSGVLTDAERGEPVIGAVIGLENEQASGSPRYTTSGHDGRFTIKDIRHGRYRLTVSYLGYDTLRRSVNVHGPATDLGNLVMKVATHRIKQVVVQVQSIRTSQKGDTVVYNADAFKVARDADTEGLLAKMPGITITDGVVEAQGETVQKVFVDGKEFFGEDVSSAVKNLPAEVVSKIEVYNKLSDQAEFTGIDDGEGYKAINIVTSLEKRQGQFGKLYAGYGFNDKYIVGGNVNLFNGDSRISLIGLANNLNQQNFSFEDILGVVSSKGTSSRGGRGMRGNGARNFMVRPQSGVSEVTSLGLNYSDTWGKKVNFTGSYFFNRTDNDNRQLTERWWVTKEGEDPQNSDIGYRSDALNYNHRFNAKLDYKINANQSLMVRPYFSYQRYDNESRSDELRYLTENPLDTLQTSRQAADGKRHGFNGGGNILYRLKLGKKGRTMTINLSGRYSKNDQTNNSFQTLINRIGSGDTTRNNQRVVNDTYYYRVGARATYTEPIDDRSLLSLEYRIDYNYSDADKKTYLYDTDNGMFDPSFDPHTSNMYNSGYLTHRIGPGYNFSDGKNNIVANLSYQRSTLTGTQDMPAIEHPKLSRSFDNVVYFAMVNANFNAANTLRVFARSYTDDPSITELQDVINDQDKQNVTVGNPSLKPAYSNRIFAHWVNSNVKRGQTLMLMLGIEQQSNFITEHTTWNTGKTAMEIRDNSGQTIYTLAPGNMFTRSVNMDGYWNIRAGISFGTPLNFIKSNLNLSVDASNYRTPSIYSDAVVTAQKNNTVGWYYNAGATLGSNISENLDFTLSYHAGYNRVQNSIDARSDNTYFTQNASGNIKWVFWKGLTFTGSIAYTQYKGITDNFNERYVICNLYLGKKVFRNQRGEVSIGINDLFDQNKSFTRTVTSRYIQNVTNNVIGRYVGIQFIYNLRLFGKRGSKNSSLYDGLDQPAGSGSVGMNRAAAGSGRPGGAPHFH